MIDNRDFKAMLDAALADDWEHPDLMAYRVERSGWAPEETHLSTKRDANRAPKGIAEAPLVEDGPGRVDCGTNQGDAAIFQSIIDQLWAHGVRPSESLASGPRVFPTRKCTAR